METTQQDEIQASRRRLAAALDLSAAAALDALAFFASREAIVKATEALERGEFTAWSDRTQRDGARELRALAKCYGTER